MNETMDLVNEYTSTITMNETIDLVNEYTSTINNE